MNPLQRDSVSTGAAACILGILVVPYLYIALGALFSFPLAFSLIMLPPLLVGSGFLFAYCIGVGPIQPTVTTNIINNKTPQNALSELF